MLPINYPSLIKFYTDQQNVLWRAEEIDYSNIRNQWDSISNERIKRFVEYILALFSQIDNIVCENIMTNFYCETEFKEAKAFLVIQSYIETVHSFVYSQSIFECIRDEKKRNKLLNSVLFFDSVQSITIWVKSYMNRDIPYLERIIGFICLEGVIFVGLFVSFYWLKSKNMLDAITTANEFISRDEAIHVNFGIELYKLTCMRRKIKLSDKQIHGIIHNCVNIASNFIHESLPVAVDNISAESVISYIKCAADNICKELDINSMYNIKHTCEWMKLILLNNKVNFFEHQVTVYSKNNIEHKLQLLDEF